MRLLFPSAFWSWVRRSGLVLGLTLSVAGGAASSTPVSAHDAQLRASAEAAVKAAGQPLDQALALLSRSQMIMHLDAPTKADRENASSDARDALRLADEIEKNTGRPIDHKEYYYFAYANALALLNINNVALKNYDLAEQGGYVQSSNLRTKGAELWGNRGIVKLRLDDFTGALADLNRALDRAPDNPLWLPVRAKTYFELGDLPAALADWDHAQAGKNPSPFPYDRDLAPFNRAIAERPDDDMALVARTRYRFAKLTHGRPDVGDNPLAKEYGTDDREYADSLRPILAELDSDVKQHPKSVALLIERARVRLVYQAHFSGLGGRVFDFDDTVNDLTRATELEPANPAAWFELGLAQLVQWRSVNSATNTMNLLATDAERIAGKKVALHAFSRAILARPEQAGFSHLLRLWTQRSLQLGSDPGQIFADADAIIQQDLAPVDVAWDALLHPA